MQLNENIHGKQIFKNEGHDLDLTVCAIILL